MPKRVLGEGGSFRLTLRFNSLPEGFDELKLGGPLDLREGDPDVRDILVYDDGIGIIEFSHEPLSRKNGSGTDHVFLHAAGWLALRSHSQFDQLRALGIGVTLRLAPTNARVPLELMRELVRLGIPLETIDFS